MTANKDAGPGSSGEFRHFVLGTPEGKTVVDIVMRPHGRGVDLQTSAAPGKSLAYGSIEVAVDSVLENAGALVLSHREDVGETLLLLELLDAIGKFRCIARVALQGDNLMECLDVNTTDLSVTTNPQAISWPVKLLDLKKSPTRVALAEIKNLSLDMTLFRRLNGRHTAGDVVASWATLCISSKREQSLGSVYELIRVGGAYSIRVTNEAKTRPLIGKDGVTWTDARVAWAHMVSEESITIKMAKDAGLPNPAIVGNVALTSAGVVPLSAVYLLDQYVCEECFSQYRRHPLEATGCLPWAGL